MNCKSIYCSAVLSTNDDVLYNYQAQPEDNTTVTGVHAIQRTSIYSATSFINILPLSQQKEFRKKQKNHR